jgi:hypothetical protein
VPSSPFAVLPISAVCFCWAHLADTGAAVFHVQETHAKASEHDSPAFSRSGSYNFYQDDGFELIDVFVLSVLLNNNLIKKLCASF